MRIDQLDKFRPSEEEKEKSFEKENETTEKPENNKQKISTAEAMVFAGLLGLKAYLVYDSKKEKVQKTLDEAKQDFQTDPTALKNIAIGLFAQLGSLTLEYERERKEQKLEIKQKAINSLQKIATEINQLRLLKDFEEIQDEAIQESLTKPQEKIRLNEEERTKLKTSMDPMTRARQEARNKTSSFIDKLTNPKRE